MKTKSILCTLSAIAALPVLSFAQTAAETTSPTSSADGGAQKTQENVEASEIKERQTTATPTTDAPRLSPTNTQTGGSTDTGSPKDNVDKNSNVDHASSTESSPR